MSATACGAGIGCPPIVPAAAAVALAAASTGMAIPVLRLLVQGELGLKPAAAGVFVAVHVAGTVVGAAARLRAGPGLALVASAALHTAIAVTTSFAALLALRFFDGIAHVRAVSALMAAGAQGSQAPRRAVFLGTALVLGLGAGAAAGGLFAERGARAPFWAASAAAMVAALVAPAGVRPSPSASMPALFSGPGGRAAASGVALMLPERFAFGVLTVLLPYALASQEVGRTLAVLFASSVFVLAALRPLVGWLGVPAVGQAGALLLSAALLGCLAPASLGPLRYAWATLAGTGAGLMFFGSFMMAARAPDLETRTRAMAQVHASGGLGYLAGSLAAGAALSLAGAGSAHWLAAALAGTATALGGLAFTFLTAGREPA